LLSEFESVRQHSVWALGQIGDKAVIKPLSMLLNQEKEDDAVRKEVLRALITIGGDEVKESIYRLLKSQWSDTALTVLKEIGDETATEPLISIFNDANESIEVKEKVVQALGRINDQTAVKTLIYALRPNPLSTEPDYRLQCMIITSLGELEDNRATEPLLRLLLNKNNELRIRMTAAMALGKIADNSIVDSLIGILKDPGEKSVKYYVASALLRLDDNKVAVPLLYYFKNDPDFMKKYELLNLDNY
jgi:HEAT repeat protein